MRHHQGLRPQPRLIALVLALCACACASAPKPEPGSSQLLKLTLPSAALGHAQNVRILLPASYASSPSTRYPVLYLLHGMYGDETNWTELTRLPELARRLPLIVVMPDADNSWYTNAYADWVARELVAHVDATYRTRPDRASRAIAGLSMGGYGAIKLALQHPDRFTFAGSLSGAFDGPRGLEDSRPEFATVLVAAFGPRGSPARVAEDVFTLAPMAPTLPALYIACGDGDPLLASSRELARVLRARNATFDYIESSGVHDWVYWDGALPGLLDAVMRSFAR